MKDEKKKRFSLDQMIHTLTQNILAYSELYDNSDGTVRLVRELLSECDLSIDYVLPVVSGFSGLTWHERTF